MKTLFLAATSHDLRQTLHAIGLFVSVLRRRSHDPAIIEVVEKIAASISYMERSCVTLLDVARLDDDAISVERRCVELSELFDSLASEFAPSASFKGLSLQILPTSCSVETDPGLLETVLRNLLCNAIKFTDCGFVRMTADRRGATVEIVVSDTGSGFESEAEPLIIDQSQPLHRSQCLREGFGLWIVRQMADLLKITVTLESQLGNGSRFTLSLRSAR
jgi:two-component system, sensor histidine kinase